MYESSLVPPEAASGPERAPIGAGRRRRRAAKVGTQRGGVADTYDALTSRRPYREPASPGVAISILREEAGRTLDAACGAAFIA